MNAKCSLNTKIKVGKEFCHVRILVQTTCENKNPACVGEQAKYQ